MTVSANVGTRVRQLLLLGAVLGSIYALTQLHGANHDGIGLIASIGLLLAVGGLCSELAGAFGIPHLTGYLVAGITVGPHVLAFIDTHSVEELSKVNTLALALIALAGGAELKISALRQVLRSLAWATLAQSLLVTVLMAGIFCLLRPLIPFTQTLSLSAALAVGLLWGVLAVSRSPSATLGILTQTRARGPLSTHTLACVMTSDVVVIILMAVALTIARPLLDPSTQLSARAFTDLAHEIIGSVSLGTMLGLLLALYIRFVKRQLLVVLVTFGFVLSEVISYLSFDTLLTFLVAGFVVQNMSKQGETFLRAIEHTGGVVYVIFFATAGAHLNIPLLRSLWPVALILSVSRMGVTWMGARAASRLAHDGAAVRTWGFAGLVSQAGLTLGLSTLIERDFPAFGMDFRALAVAVVAINEVVGPILFKLALDRTGESALRS